MEYGEDTWVPTVHQMFRMVPDEVAVDEEDDDEECIDDDCDRPDYQDCREVGVFFISHTLGNVCIIYLSFSTPLRQAERQRSEALGNQPNLLQLNLNVMSLSPIPLLTFWRQRPATKNAVSGLMSAKKRGSNAKHEAPNLRFSTRFSDD